MSHQSSSFRGLVRTYFVRGAFLIVPLLVTIIVINFALGFLRNLLRPSVGTIRTLLGVGEGVDPIVLEGSVALGLLVIVLGIGVVATHLPTGSLGDVIHAMIETVPGFGSIYSNVRQMSQMIAGEGADSFEDVMLVEFPTKGVYALAFVTADTPESIKTAVSETEMRTLMLPMGPNPLMGGFTVYVPADRVYDIDIPVDEGLKAVATSGMTLTHDLEDKSVIEEVRDIDLYDELA